MTLQMRLKIVFFLLQCIATFSFAQQDSVLLRINGKQILRSEFEYKLNKDHKSDLKGKLLKAYLNRYIDNQLKINVAECAGIDTTQTIREQLNDYSKQLVRAYLSNGQTDEDYARALYDKLSKRDDRREVQIVQIYKYLSQNASSRVIERVKNQMDSIYFVLQSRPQLFDQFVKHFSDRKDTAWVAYLNQPEEIEQRIFALSANQFTEPFFSSKGIHIVKLISRRNIAPFEQLKDELIHQLDRSYDKDEKMGLLTYSLENEFHYTPCQEGLREVQEKGETLKTLFTLNGKSYTGSDFNRFAMAHPMEINSQLDAFKARCILDCESKKLIQEHSEFALRMKLYRDNLLIAAEDKIAMPVSPDSIVLREYFERHQSDYRWSSPRFDGAVLYSIDKKTGKKVRKILKKLPKQEWASLLATHFNQNTETVRMEQGLFAEGDNKAVDQLAFKKEGYTPSEKFPYTILVGRKRKRLTDYRDVFNQLSIDYINYMEQQWMEHLRVAGKVEINEEVLKTVNNH